MDEQEREALPPLVAWAPYSSLPPLPGHPEPHAYRWTTLEESAIREYARQAVYQAEERWQARAALAAKGVPADLVKAHEALEQLLKAAEAEEGIRDDWDQGYRAGLRAALAATPAQAQQAEPLSDEQIDRVTDAQWAINNHKPIYAAHRAFARAIEQAHGIKENQP